MREIILTNGGIARVDDADYPTLAAHNWQRHKGGYAYRFTRRRPAPGVCILMHREIMQPGDGLHVDHADGNGLNNQRANLRTCTRSQNLANRPGQKNRSASRYKGVTLSSTNRWRARCGAVTLGYFATEAEAAEAYNRAAAVKYGEFAILNVIQANNKGLAA